MGGRPNLLQFWGDAAAAGALVQPPSGIAGSGFPTAYRPPAEWINWIFCNVSEWLNYLRGANSEHWTRTAWGTSPATFDSGTAIFLAVDTETQDSTGAAFRYLIAGQETDTPNTAALRTSKRGNEWVRRTNVTADATAVPTALAYADNPASSGRWLLGCNDGSINYCTVDAGGGTGPVGSGSGTWSVASTPGGMTNVVAFAVKEATKIFALTDDGGVQSADHGITWTDYAGTSGTARSGNGSDACWTGSAFLFITTDGQVYKSATMGGVFAYVTDLGATATWRLATDGAGGVLAYRVNNGSTLDIFWSDDDGGTWETITPTAGFNRIQRIRHHEGTWLACSTVAPFLWASNDHETWRKLRMPVGSDAALYDLAWDGGAWIVAGNGFVLQCPRGHDPGDADGVWTPGSTATRLIDAAYIRGVEVDSTAPTNGQVLVYGSTAGRWEPTTLTSSSPTTTRGDLIRRGSSADERFAAKDADTFVGGDGTDVGVRTAAQVRVSLGLPAALAPSPTGLVLDLDADDLSGSDGDSISAWADGGFSFGAAGSARPVLREGARGIGGRQAVFFDGSDDVLECTDGSLDLSTLTLFVVSANVFDSSDALATNRWLITRMFNTSNGSPYSEVGIYIPASGTAVRADGTEYTSGLTGVSGWEQPVIWCLSVGAAGTRLHANGRRQIAGAATGVTYDNSAPWCLGGRGASAAGEHARAIISRVILYSGQLSAAERQRVEGALAQRYSIPIVRSET